MTDYSKLVEALRCPEHDKLACPDCYHNKCYANSGKGLWCRVPVLMADAAAAIEALQAQLPKRGEWIGKSDDDSLVKCSVCGHIRIGSSLWYCKQYVPYCENCGAKMMEVQDGKRCD